MIGLREIGGAYWLFSDGEAFAKILPAAGASDTFEELEPGVGVAARLNRPAICGWRPFSLASLLSR